MGELVNLRRARKAKTRARAEETAAAKRAEYGTPKALQKATKTEKERADRKTDAHKLDRL